MEHPPTSAAAERIPQTTGIHRPVQEGERIAALDVLRGFALMGIFLVNIQFFSLPILDAPGLLTLGDAPAGEVWGWAFIRTFCELKFVSLFSLLFGMGMAVQLIRAKAAGRPFVGYYLRRTFVLALFGLTHALLLWYGDILFLYACVSLLLFALCGLNARVLLTICAILVGISVLVSTSMAALQWVAAEAQMSATSSTAAASPTSDVASDDSVAVVASPRGFDAISAAQFDPSRDVWREGEVLAYTEGPLADAFAFRSLSYAFALIGGIVGYGWHVLSMFLLGAALIKLDFFSRDKHHWHRRLLWASGGAGVVLEATSTTICMGLNFDLGPLGIVAAMLHEIGSYALCLGYVGGVTLLVHAGVLGWLQHAIACVGRTALSNYLGQTVIATSIMYWWGLAWFGELSRPRMIGLVFVIYATQMLVSTLWLRVFRIGPMEWLWRSLTYLKPQPLLRTH